MDDDCAAEARDKEVIVAVFHAGKSDSQTLDLVFDSYTEFVVHGSCIVHISGYYMPDDDSDDEDYDHDHYGHDGQEGLAYPYGTDSDDDSGDAHDFDDSDDDD